MPTHSGIEEEAHQGAEETYENEVQEHAPQTVNVFHAPLQSPIFGPGGTVINRSQTFPGAGSFGLSAEAGRFEIGTRIVVLENQPISRSSRVFHAEIHSEVTGTRRIVVKITPFDPKHQREAKIHFSVPHHRNIVERIATDSFNFRGLQSLYIAMERCDCNLHDHIESQVREEVPFDHDKYISIARQIVVALNFLHSKNIVHGDLKPGNVLLILDGNIVKLSDFGLSRSISEGQSSAQLTSPQGGTNGWQAPEILRGTNQITKSSDIFPLGLVMYYCFSYGKHSYGDVRHSWNHFILVGGNRDLERMLIPTRDIAKTLLELMMQPNPADRPTANQVLEHQFFASEVPTLETNQPHQTDDTQLVETIDKALRILTAAAEEVQEEVTDFGFTASQLSNAIRTVLDRRQLQISSTHTVQAQVPNPEESTQPKELLTEARSCLEQVARPSSASVLSPSMDETGSSSCTTFVPAGDSEVAQFELSSFHAQLFEPEQSTQPKQLFTEATSGLLSLNMDETGPSSNITFQSAGDSEVEQFEISSFHDFESTTQPKELLNETWEPVACQTQTLIMESHLESDSGPGNCVEFEVEKYQGLVDTQTLPDFESITQPTELVHETLEPATSQTSQTSTMESLLERDLEPMNDTAFHISSEQEQVHTQPLPEDALYMVQGSMLSDALMSSLIVTGEGGAPSATASELSLTLRVSPEKQRHHQEDWARVAGEVQETQSAPATAMAAGSGKDDMLSAALAMPIAQEVPYHRQHHLWILIQCLKRSKLLMQ